MRLDAANKSALGFAALLAVFLVLSIVILNNLSTMETQFRFVVEHDAPVIANAQLLSKLVVDMETGQRGFVITGKDEFLQPYSEGIAAFEILLNKEKELVSDNASQVRALDKIQHLVHEWQDKAAKPEIAMRRAAGAINQAELRCNRRRPCRGGQGGNGEGQGAGMTNSCSREAASPRPSLL